MSHYFESAEYIDWNTSDIFDHSRHIVMQKNTDCWPSAMLISYQLVCVISF